MTDETRLARMAPGALDRLAFEPQSLADLTVIAGAMYESGLLPAAIKTPAAAAAIIHYGRTLGLDVWQSFRGIHIIQGQPSPNAGLMHALCVASEACEYFVPREQSPERVTWATKRRGSPDETIAEYTAAEAKRAGLTGGNWAKYPTDMLNARCKARLARLVYPDVCGGMYIPDELESVRLESKPSTLAEKLRPAPQADDVVDVDASDVLDAIDAAAQKSLLADFKREVIGIIGGGSLGMDAAKTIWMRRVPESRSLPVDDWGATRMRAQRAIEDARQYVADAEEQRRLAEAEGVVFVDDDGEREADGTLPIGGA